MMDIAVISVQPADTQIRRLCYASYAMAHVATVLVLAQINVCTALRLFIYIISPARIHALMDCFQINGVSVLNTIY